MKKFSIIIPTYNPPENFPQLLRELQKEIKTLRGWEGEILIVDNASMQWKLEKELALRNITVLKNTKNEGFARACNRGIREARDHGADAVLLLNQDTAIQSNFLQVLLDHPASIVSPVLQFKREKQWVYDYGGKVHWWTGRTIHKESSNYPINKLSNKQIDYVSGCCMRITSSVFETIGYLDERYRMYFEDVDFCLRAKRAGLSIAVVPQSSIVHFLSEGKKKSLFQTYHMIHSNLLFIHRWIPWYRKPVAYLYWWILVFKNIIPL